MFDLKDKVAVVTGGSRGIGRTICMSLAQLGARVVVGYGTGEAAAQDVVDTIGAAGGEAERLGFDVADMTATERAVAEVAERHGRLDIMVANAGIAIDGLLLRVKEPDLDRLLAVNLKGAIASAKGALKPMMRKRRGRVIFVSSVVGEMGNVGQVGYAATKAGLLGVMKSLAREYAGRNITVNAVTPGFIATDMTAGLSDEVKANLERAVPLGRIGRPEDVAAAVAFLCSDEAGYVTGETLRVNGGMYV
ncbi:MAG: 3-oxoacyl-ACP reductase family protein [Myxococcota bacterium]